MDHMDAAMRASRGQATYTCCAWITHLIQNSTSRATSVSAGRRAATTTHCDQGEAIWLNAVGICMTGAPF